VQIARGSANLRITGGGVAEVSDKICVFGWKI